MFNFIIQNNHIYSDITGIMMDPAIIISIDKTRKMSHGKRLVTIIT